MTKAQKKQLEDFLKLLEEAHDGIRQALTAKKQPFVLDLLNQCQECAIKLGEIIEEIEGEEAATIPWLENYCELTYQLYEQCQQSLPASPKPMGKALQKSLAQIRHSVQYDIPERKEIVFLPYKASMWDSLESVWKAADEDPNCDAYVIPIPYYDKNPDGSFRQMHYEGDQYPSYVPITDYNAYDLAVRRPDIIFIHNPYDDCNFVTSVDPRFYSKVLKEYTDKLVYIPYFVLGEVADPDNLEALKPIEHFFLVPGVFNADTVIVQSENMRRAYINVLTERSGKNTRDYWKKKILGLGSPKMDKIQHPSAEDEKIPAEWLPILKKPDGGYKKVILYNTSVNALLHENEKMLKKMRSVFQVFHENREDIALLWRPHPLIQATIESMRPKLWSEYQELVTQYQKEGWGIYDDSAQLNRAIQLCDAYYGDGSSLVQLCQKAGKPIMIQNVNILEED